MDCTQKASVSKKVRNQNLISICIIGSISILGFVMAIYSLFNGKFGFTAIYLIAVLFGFSYVVMRLNTVMPTYIAADEKYIHIRNWENGLFPFRVDKGITGEFLPEKTVLKKVDISAVSLIYIGSRNYLLKLVPDGNFSDILQGIDKRYLSMIKRSDYIYIHTRDGREIYLNVTDYDPKELAELIKPIIEKNEKIDFKSNNRKISKLIPPKRSFDTF